MMNFLNSGSVANQNVSKSPRHPDDECQKMEDILPIQLQRLHLLYICNTVNASV